MPNPVTAHGWTTRRPRYGADLVTDDGHFRAFVESAPTFEGTQGPAAAADALVRCIEDAATLAQAREMAAALHRGENIFTGQVDDIHRLLALLTEDGTP